LKPAHLEAMARVIPLDDLPMAFDTLLKGQARGRFIVNLRA
jgi:D-arabinose 1-dehydrogenase-like Zn-dependent alcohol dehydrogenase